jgi:lipoate---protein ligase
MPQPWRLLPFLVADGQQQMAIDEAIFVAVERGESLRTLRFYQWNPIALSLGYHQRNYPDHWRSLQAVDLVRRPTGGRAVLHQGDLTYAVIASGMSPSRTESYRQICEFLIQGWRSLGYELSYGSAGRGYIQNPDCFGTATGADLVLPDGRKLIGSAQKRSADIILQHGSMRLQPDPKLFEAVFGARSDNQRSENQRSENLESIPNYLMPSTEQIIPALISAAETCFDMKVTIGALSPQEEESVARSLFWH